MIKKFTIQLIGLLMLGSLSQILYAQINNDPAEEYPDSTLSLNNNGKEVNLVFHSISTDHITSPVTVIDVEKELQRDQRANLSDLINGKVPGVFGSYNIWGTGNAVILVDGIPQESFYISTLSLLEIESVVILKDALSKAMFGAQGDNGVILVNTKRGKAGKHQLRVVGEYGGAMPRAMPKYLGSADYMEKYLEAQANDAAAAGNVLDPIYIAEKEAAIAATRSGENPILYPDNDFYSDRYIRDYTTGARVFADVSGGNENVRYYVNTGWNQSTGWLNTPQGDIANRLNFRGNLDFAINKYMEMSLDATARLSLYEQPNAGYVWSMASSELPNNYPVLWDPNVITSENVRDFISSDANLVDGMLLGGNPSFLNNAYGRYVQNGNMRLMQRDIQFSGKLNLDLSFITKGLSAGIYGGIEFYNTLYTNQDPDYAVYEPVFNEGGKVDSVIVHGFDRAANKYHTNADNSDFFRKVSYYGSLNYKRSFGDHDFAANAVIYNNMLTLADQLQKDFIFHTGLSVSYLYKSKYALEASLMGIGSRKLNVGQRMENAPSLGLGWILSEENFLSGVSFIDYLKVRSTYGISKNDDWNGYYLYKGTFVRGSSFHYQNRISRNGETVFTSWSNDIFLQKRKDFTLGLDASLLDKALNIELTYFNSESIDNVTLMSSTFPQVLGYEHAIYSNYNSDLTKGLDLGLDYTFRLEEDFSITAGIRGLFISPKITKRQEPLWDGDDAGLLREGSATDAMWGLKSDGLYSEDDFDPDGTLLDDLAVPAYGKVYPGDIKYIDQNDDDIVNQNDIRIIGNGIRTQYSVFLDVKFRNIEFYALGIGQMGDHNYRSGSYFRVFGNDKYSEMVNEAYGPNNLDPNASHPRLTTTDGNHNDRNSDYWIYKNNSFVVPTMQLTYHFKGVGRMDFIKNSRVYLRADNMVITGKNKKYTEINPGGAPRTKGLSIGFVTSF